MAEPASDFDDLRDYARTGCERAFARIVNRHVDMVFSAALRRTGDSHLADDITQSTFLVLAREARKLRPDVHLAAWLLKVTRLTASNAVRLKIRRQHYERKAGQAMAAARDQSASEHLWAEISPHLDDAVLALRADDRRIVVLRFFENRNSLEAARIIGVSEEAARQRLSRAIARLRTILIGRCSQSLSVPALSEMLGQHCGGSAPSHLAAAVAAAHATGPTAQVATLVKGTAAAIGISSAAAAGGAIAATLLVLMGVSGIVTMNGHASTASAQAGGAAHTTAPASMPAIIEPRVVARDAHPVAAEMYRILDAARLYAKDHQQDGREHWPSRLAELEPYLNGQDIHLERYLYTFPADLDQPDFSEVALLEVNPQERAPDLKFIGGQFMAIGDGVVLYTPSLYWARARKGQPGLLLLDVCEPDPDPLYLSGVLATFIDPHDPTGTRRVAVGRTVWMSGPCFDSARVVAGPAGQFSVQVVCKDQFKRTLLSHSTDFKGRRMALVLCEANQFDLLTAPLIMEPMADAFPIAGPFTKEQADALAARINHVLSTLPK